jgi:hypothetical protein
MKKKLFIGMLAVVFITILSLPAVAKKDRPVGFGFLYYDGEVVRTVVPPAAMPFMGRDNLYAFPNGEQMAITAVAPGDSEYHGGQWALHLVTWGTDPYPLTSEDEVLTAADAGDITIERVPENDFKCPIQP